MKKNPDISQRPSTQLVNNQLQTVNVKRRPRAISDNRSKLAQNRKNDVLAIIVDQKSGDEYYVAQIDNFIFRDNEYCLMYNYEPDYGEHVEPQIVIMRSYRDTDGEQIFTSIRDDKEIATVFEIFYERFARSKK